MRTIRPPCPLAATDMLPPIRKASPPNIFFSTTPSSAASSSRMRFARSSSYAMARIIAHLALALATLLMLGAAPARAELQATTGDGGVRFHDGDETVLQATAIGYRTAAGEQRATRQTGPATFATSDGRTLEVRASRDAEGVVALAIAPPAGALATWIAFAARPDERFLGFGERSNALDQRGREVEVFVGEGPYQPEERAPIAAFVLPWGYHPRDDATYFPMPWVLSSAGYGLLLDDPETSRFDLRAPGSWRAEVDAPRLRLRVFAGPTPATALARFTARVGRQPPVATPWHLGTWMQPSGEDDATELARVKLMRQRDVPVSVAETFVHYLPCAAQLDDRAAVRARTANLHAQGVAALAYFNPMICTAHPRYDEAARAGWLTKDATGQPYRYRYSTNSQFLVSQVDFTAPGAAAFYGSLLRDALDDGSDGWREDFGEYTPPDARSADGTPGAAMHNLYPTLYHGAASAQTAGRPVANYVRSGFTGTARSARIVWGGDPTTDWGFDGLASAVTEALTMGTSGVSTWGSDIGGFFALGERKLTPDLLRRWVQFGAVSGVMRTEAEGIALPSKPRPQVFDADQIAHWRRYAKLRTQLYPYLEAADADYQRTGLPIMRALELEWPGLHSESEFLFGPDVLAAPVLQPGATQRALDLPPGAWVDLWRSARQRESDGALELTGPGRVLDGGRRVTLPAPIDELPLLVRAGAVLPLLSADVDTLAPYRAPGAVSLDDRGDRLTLLAFPRGYRSARMYRGEHVVSAEKRNRTWVLRIEGTRRRRYDVQAAFGATRRAFRACSARANGRRVRLARRDGGRSIRASVKGRRVRLEVRACR